MKKYILIINTCICLAAFLFANVEEACSQSAGAQTNNVETLLANKSARVDSLFVQWSQENSPGIAVLVMKDGKVIYKKGFGLANMETETPITPETIFDLASIGKQFTAMCIMMLTERGKLAYDDPLSKFFPEFPAYAEKITIRHLLNHTAGFTEYAELYIQNGKIDSNYESPSNQARLSFQPTSKDVLNLLSQQNLLRFIPGDDWEYSDAAYVILGQIVEKVSGESLAQFMHDNIFKPTGMKHTLLVDETKPEIQNLAVSYMSVGNELKGTNSNPLSLIYGDGNVNSSIEDLVKWYAALDNNKLVKASTLSQAFTSGKLNNGVNTGYGFGWFVSNASGLERAAHSGTWMGFHNVVAYYPKEHFVALILSNDGRLTRPDRSVLINRLTKIYLADKMMFPAPVQISSELMQQYAAKYELEDGSQFDISFDGSALWIKSGRLLPVKLIPESEVKFFVDNAEDDWYFFVKDNKGKVLGLNSHLSFTGYTKLAYGWARKV